MAYSLLSKSLALILVCFTGTGNAELERREHPSKADGSLSFLVVGDWGRRGSYNQSQVALQMGRIGEKLEIDFVVSTGDNFYDNGLSGVNDQAFQESFTNIYTANSLQKNWYAVLGNHDYRGDVEAQFSHVLRKIDSRWVCLRSFVVDTEIAEFFFMDTTPFVRNYFTTPEDHTYDWRSVIPRNKYVTQLLKDLESALRESRSKWKIVVGHHAIRSIGHHGDTEELVDHLLPILQDYDVDFYINGHDHCLEHINSTNSRIQFLTSGAGSKAWRGDIKVDREGEGGGLKQTDGVNFFYDGQGFMSMELIHNTAKLVFYDVFGKVLHSWDVFKYYLHSTM